MFNLFANTCNHVYGKVEGYYQYCTKCGKAIVIPVCMYTAQIQNN